MPGGRATRGLRPAAFLDRDGVINRDIGYIGTREQFHFIAGAAEACRAIGEMGYQLIVVTNQGGIGLGHYSEDDFRRLTDWMLAELGRAGAQIAAVYHSPWHPRGDQRYAEWAHLRKPAPGMLLQAARDRDIDLSKSFMVGDKVSDMQAAEAAGVPLRFLVGAGGEVPAGVTVCDSLAAVPELLLRHG